MTEGSIPSHSTTKEAKNRRRFVMAVVYEKVTLLVVNDMNYRLSDFGFSEFESLIETTGFRVIDYDWELLDGPQIQGELA